MLNILETRVIPPSFLERTSCGNLYFIQFVDEHGYDLDLMVRADSVDGALIDWHQVTFGEDEGIETLIVLDPYVGDPIAALSKEGVGVVSRILDVGNGPILWHDKDFMVFERAFSVSTREKQ